MSTEPTGTPKINIAVAIVGTNGEEGIRLYQIEGVPPYPKQKEVEWDDVHANEAHNQAQWDRIGDAIGKALGEIGLTMNRRKL